MNVQAVSAKTTSVWKAAKATMLVKKAWFAKTDDARPVAMTIAAVLMERSVNQSSVPNLFVLTASPVQEAKSVRVDDANLVPKKLTVGLEKSAATAVASKVAKNRRIVPMEKFVPPNRLPASNV